MTRSHLPHQNLGCTKGFAEENEQNSMSRNKNTMQGYVDVVVNPPMLRRNNEGEGTAKERRARLVICMGHGCYRLPVD